MRSTPSTETVGAVELTRRIYLVEPMFDPNLLAYNHKRSIGDEAAAPSDLKARNTNESKGTSDLKSRFYQMVPSIHPAFLTIKHKRSLDMGAAA